MTNNMQFDFDNTVIRKNILIWYPFKKTDTVLIIGNKLKNIVELLSSRVKSVDTLNDIALKNDYDSFKYDYVIVYDLMCCDDVNVKEYYEETLENAKSYLSSGGKLLLSTGNSNGLKYWCQNVKENSFINKIELEQVLKTTGFSNYRFYYPFPDHIITYAIYTDDYLPDEISFRRDLIFNYNDNLYYLNPIMKAHDIVENQMISSMANAFLVEASLIAPVKKEINYVKLNKNRNKKYAAITKIFNDKTVTKEPMYIEEKEHLLKMVDTHNKLSEIGVKCSKITEKNGILNIEYIDGIRLTDKLNECFYRKDKATFIQLVDDAFKHIYDKLVEQKDLSDINNSIFDFTDIYFDKIEVLKMGLIDLNFSNVFINNGEFTLFDQEWITDEYLPFDYIKYFCIKLLYEQILELDQFIPASEFYDKYDISNDKQNAFNKASEKFFFEQKNAFDLDIYKVLLEMQHVRLFEEKYKDEILKYDDELNATECELELVTKELNKIVNSRSWKIVSKLRKMVRR